MKSLLTILLIVTLTITAFGAPNGGKKHGNPRHLPKMIFVPVVFPVTPYGAIYVFMVEVGKTEGESR